MPLVCKYVKVHSEGQSGCLRGKGTSWGKVRWGCTSLDHFQDCQLVNPFVGLRCRCPTICDKRSRVTWSLLMKFATKRWVVARFGLLVWSTLYITLCSLWVCVVYTICRLSGYVVYWYIPAYIQTVAVYKWAVTWTWWLVLIGDDWHNTYIHVYTVVNYR